MLDFVLENKMTRLKNFKSKTTTSKWFGPDPLKWATLVVSLIGIVAWTGGTAYFEGYWSTVGWGTPIVSKSIQETAYAGFTGTIINWISAAFGILCLGTYIALLEFLGKLPVPQFLNRQRTQSEPWRIVKWLSSGKKFDPTMTRVIALMIVSGLGLAVVFVLPGFLWCYGAYWQGKAQINKAICEARVAKVFHSTIMLTEGGKMSGIIIDRSDKVTILLDRSAVHVIATGEKSVLLDTTSVEHITCSAK
jgi:hypothetical protein